MNKALTFWTAPVTALFLPKVYHDASKSSAGRGVLYVLYLSALSVLLAMWFLLALVVPKADQFSKWFGSNMPVMTWTPDGLSWNGPQSVKMEHPQYGLVAIFDMDKTNVNEEDFGSAYVYVTSHRLFIKKKPGEVQEFDLTRTGEEAQRLPPKIQITENVAAQVYKNMKRSMLVIIPIVFLLFFFFLHLLSNLFYSLVGLFLNLTRKTKLGYGAIFNLTCFATTAGFALMCLKALLPIAIPFIVYIAINVVYLVVVFKVTDQKAPEAQA